MVKAEPEILISLTNDLQVEYLNRGIAGKESFYYECRDRYNNAILDANHRTALFIFLNHTCFNGLFRVNTAGHFNVPFGRYNSPVICDPSSIMETHRVMNSLAFTILPPGDYKNTAKHLSRKGLNFIYLDPPYRPLSNTSYYKGYSNEPFGDKQQVDLKLFCDKLTDKGHYLMLSNSNSLKEDGTSYFEDLYEGYNLCKVEVPRFINANGLERRRIKEVLIRNY